MRGLRILLLGNPVLEFDGQPLTRLMAVKHQALVFYLAAHDRPLPRGSLATLLWGDLDEADARANLRMALSRLRRWLPDALTTDAREVGFSAAHALCVDLHELEAGCRLPPDAPFDSLIAAADCYRGTLLDGFDLPGTEEFESWRRQAGERATRLAVDLRRRLTERLEADGLQQAAIAQARAWLAIDEIDESAHCALMRLLASNGQRTAAIAQYESCRAILADRLGARPSAATYRLYCRIHADAPRGGSATRLEAVAVRPGGSPGEAFLPIDTALSSAAGDTELIGRDADLASIAERLLDPACHMLTLIGPGGVGKTCMAIAVAAALRTRFAAGTIFISGRDLAGVGPDHETLAESARQRLADGRALVVLDNLESVAQAQRLVSALAQAVPDASLLVTSRSRIGGSREWLFEMTGLSTARDSEGTPASSPAARLFIRHARRFDARFDARRAALAIERICAAVGGLPLALEMAAHGLLLSDCDAIAARIEAGVPLENPERDPGDRHRSLEAVLLESWTMLPDPAQQAAIRIAALPEAFESRMACAVAGVDDNALDILRANSWLSAATDGRLAMHPLQREFTRRRPDDTGIARNVDEALARHVLASLDPVAPFADVPAQAGVRMNGYGPGTVAPVVAHVARNWSPDPLAAFVDTLTAHLNAAGRVAEAVALLGTAVERTDLPRWRRAGWMLRSAELLNETGDLGGGLSRYRRGFELAGLSGFELDGPSWRQTLAGLRVIRRAEGWTNDPADRSAFTRVLVRALVMMSKLILFTPRAAPAFRAAVLGRSAAQRLPAPERTTAAAVNGFALALFGYPRAGERFARWALARMPTDGRDRISAIALEGMAAVRVASGQWEGVVDSLDRTSELMRDLRCTRHYIECRSLAAKLVAYEGRLPAAWERFSTLVDDSHAMGCATADHFGLLGMVETDLNIGHLSLEELFALLAQARRDMSAMANIDSAYTMRWLGLRAKLEWQAERFDAAQDVALTGASAARRLGNCGFWVHEGLASLAEVLLLCRSHERRRGGALPVLDDALAATVRAMKQHVRGFPPGGARLLQLQGLAAADTGRTAPAIRALRESVRQAEHYGMRVTLARSCELLARLGQVDRENWLQRAKRLYDASGAQAQLRRLEEGRP